MSFASLVFLATQVPFMSVDVALATAPPAALAAPRPLGTRPVAPPPPALAQSERTKYKVAFGGLDVGEMSLSIGGAAPGATVVHAAGQGAGSVLGLGRFTNQVDVEFDLARLDSLRWVNARTWGAQSLRDRGEQRVQGQVSGVRERLDPKTNAKAGEAPLQARLAGPLLDPVGFILRLRAAMPARGAAPQVLYVLDGQAYWRLRVTNHGRETLPEGFVRAPVERVQVEADPIHYDGTPDQSADRHHRSISIWISDDANRVPVRLAVSLGVGDLVASLVEIERRAPSP